MAHRASARAHGRTEPVRRWPRARGAEVDIGSVVATHTGADLGAAGWSWTPAGSTEPVLSALDLEINPGERVLLLGASGSGKSTLLQAWAGVLGGDDEGASSGRLTVDGVAPADARGRVGLLLQDPDAQLVLARAHDDVAFGPENLGVEVGEIERRVPEALDSVGLALPADVESARLSGGQQQRLALAGVLAMRPAALLLDEPTAQLDPEGVRDVAATVAALVADSALTLVVVEHRVDVWAPLVDRVIVLEGGRVIADGPIDEVLAARGDELASGGVWVPGRAPDHPVAPAVAVSAATVLQARGVDVRPAGGESLGITLDLEVRAGEVLALTGPNGAGKSTLLQSLAGLLPLASGELDVLGHGSPAEWRSRDLAARLGVVFQNPEHQFVAATVRDELAVGPRALGRELDGIEPLLQRLGLRHLADASPFSLSGGEQRRLSVATALATRPGVLLLDEPTFGQDSRTWAELVALLAEYRDAGGAVVMATHDRALVETLGARELALSATPTVRPDSPAREGDSPTRGTEVSGSQTAPLEHPRPKLVERLNPVAAIAASLVPALVLVSTIDVVSAAVALGLQALLLPWLGVPLRTLLRRSAPILIAAPFAALTIALYGETSGTVYAEWLLVRISDGSLELALATFLRILAIGLPAMALFARPDATRLGDALGQNLRLPSRFVLGGVAALRLLTVLRDDARLLERARRARGLGDRGRVRRALSLVVVLLVLSVRRGSALAIGMEARGFGAAGPRTWLRPSPWRASDTVVVIVAIGVSIIAVGTALALGTFNGILR